MKHRDYEPVDLQRAGFKVHQLEGFEKDNIENAFTGYVLGVLGKINDGKEASVYLCRTEHGLEADRGGLAAGSRRPRFSSRESFATSTMTAATATSAKCVTDGQAN